MTHRDDRYCSFHGEYKCDKDDKCACECEDLWEYDERCSVFTPPNCLGERDTLGVAEMHV